MKNNGNLKNRIEQFLEEKEEIEREIVAIDDDIKELETESAMIDSYIEFMETRPQSKKKRGS